MWMESARVTFSRPDDRRPEERLETRRMLFQDAVGAKTRMVEANRMRSRRFLWKQSDSTRAEVLLLSGPAREGEIWGRAESVLIKVKKLHTSSSSAVHRKKSKRF